MTVSSPVPALMSGRVAALLDTAFPHLPPGLRDDAAAVRAGLDEPLRIAVVGRVKAGKSTLVNALLGQRVAPTAVGECTRMVTWFRFGHPQRVEVHLRDGTRKDLPLGVDGRVPGDVGIPHQDVASLQVWLTNEGLRDLTVIDTPGLASLNEDVSASTEELLAFEHTSASAAASADAVVLVINDSPRSDELEAVRTFAAHDGEAARSSVNAVGVLTKADQAGGGGPGAWEAACRLAARHAERLRGDLALVVPVVGLIAETCEAALLTESDASGLAALAAMPSAERDLLMLTPDRFAHAEAPVPAQTRARLLELLDLFGVEQAIRLIEAGTSGAHALRTELSRISGVAVLDDALHVVFRRRSDALKARQALGRVEAITYRGSPQDATVMAWLRDGIEQLRLDPAMHELAELEALHAVRSGEVSLPGAMAEEVERMIGATDVTGRLGVDPASDEATLRSAAVAAAGRWRAFTMRGADARQAHLARVMIRSYTLAIQGLEGGTT